ncbi:unnamed protein product, partial [Rotaria sordida]
MIKKCLRIKVNNVCFNAILGDQITSSTTETDVNSDDDKENRRKRQQAIISDDKLNDKRRCLK